MYKGFNLRLESGEEALNSVYRNMNVNAIRNDTKIGGILKKRPMKSGYMRLWIQKILMGVVFRKNGFRK